jgi:hypothetical protein
LLLPFQFQRISVVRIINFQTFDDWFMFNNLVMITLNLISNFLTEEFIKNRRENKTYNLNGFSIIISFFNLKNI